MNRSTARGLVENNGIDAEELCKLLVQLAVDEFSNYYHYTLLKLNLIGVEGEALKRIIEDARQEDLNHFHALIPRIYELGGSLPASLDQCRPSAASPVADAVGSEHIRAVLESLLKAAEQSVRSYTQICNMTCGKDNRTYGLALAILHEEIEHQIWYLEFLGHGPERVSREGRSLSPFVQKYLQNDARNHGGEVYLLAHQGN